MYKLLKHIIQIIRNNLIFSFIFTIIYIFIYLWNRFIRIRLPREINYHEILTISDKIIVIIFLSYFLLFSYYFLTYLKVIPNPKSKVNKIFINFINYLESKKYINIIMTFINKHIINGFDNVYKYLYIFIYIKPFIWFCANILHKYFINNPLIPYLLFLILPRIIIIIILFIEIVFFNYIYIFYKILILLSIPLIFKIILYMIEHHAKSCLDVFNEYFDFKVINDDDLEISFKLFDDPIKLQEQQNLLRQAENDWMAYQNMYSITVRINREKSVYNNIINTMIYCLYVITFGIYILKIVGIL